MVAVSLVVTDGSLAMGGTMLRKLSAAAAALCLAGCATSYGVTPMAAASQDIQYDHGTALVMSKKDHGAVRVAPTATTFQKRIGLGVVAFNDGSQPMNLGVENVHVFTASGTPVQVFTYEQLVREAKTAAAWQTFAVALAAGANAYAAAQPTTYNTYGSAYGNRGYVNYQATTTVYNPTTAAISNQINQAQTERSLGQISATLNSTLSSLGGSILRTTTVRPGEAFGGQVMVDRPKFAKGEDPSIRVVVDFAGEQHEFKFAVGPPS